METIRSEHLSEAEIEDCVRSRILRDTAPAVLSHLTNCDHCAALLQQEAQLRREFRETLKAAHLQVPDTESRWSRVRAFPAPALAAITAIGWFLLFAPVFQPVTGKGNTVELTAYRGNSNAKISSNAPLILKMDARGLDDSGGIELRIVDGSGRQVWHSVPHLVETHWVDVVNRRFSRGVYWVRLSAHGQVDPAREFRLDID